MGPLISTDIGLLIPGTATHGPSTVSETSRVPRSHVRTTFWPRRSMERKVGIVTDETAPTEIRQSTRQKVLIMSFRFVPSTKTGQGTEVKATPASLRTSAGESVAFLPPPEARAATAAWPARASGSRMVQSRLDCRLHSLRNPLHPPKRHRAAHGAVLE